MNHLKNKPILFEFKGTVSKPCRRYLLRRVSMKDFWIGLIMYLVTFAFMVLVMMGVLDGEIDPWLWWLILGLAVGSVLFSGLCAALIYTEKEQAKLFAERICFLNDEDNTVIIEIAKERKIEYSDLFKKILDMGDFYIIPSSSGRGIVCEKALMTQGTPEEFDAKFAEKIEKKDIEKK